MSKHHDLWEAVIGLEVHVQLNTKSKLFSSAPNRFGDEPNTNISEICTGQPGALPFLNEEALKKAIQFGLAIDAPISNYSTFDRKSYFYPDSPRNFQITQFEHPIIQGGTISAEVNGEHKTFKVKEAHIEDDAGMLKHFTNFTGIDYNRAGVPLLEIVSEPVIHTSKEAVAYVMTIKAIMEYLDASDCNMEEGSLRVDANISIRPKGEKKLRNKTEIKNMNSFSQLEAAIDAEINRQIHLYSSNQDKDYLSLLEPATYRFDVEKKELILMRKKESAEDYRYFPEPDLPPIVVTEEMIEKERARLPELPQERFKRYLEEFSLTPASAIILINEKRLADFFEEANVICQSPQILANWITVEFAGRLKEKNETLFSLNIQAKDVGKLIKLIQNGKITGKIAKMVADDMVTFPGRDPEKIVQDNPDYQPLSDEKLLFPIIDAVILENQKSVEDYKSGKTKAFAFLVGQVMQRTKGKASPDLVNAILKKRIEEK